MRKTNLHHTFCSHHFLYVHFSGNHSSGIQIKQLVHIVLVFWYIIFVVFFLVFRWRWQRRQESKTKTSSTRAPPSPSEESSDRGCQARTAEEARKESASSGAEGTAPGQRSPEDAQAHFQRPGASREHKETTHACKLHLHLGWTETL